MEPATARVGYRVVERMSPLLGEHWLRYVEWSRLAQLEEVIGLDCMLCPRVHPDFLDEDWNHFVFPEHLSGCFDDAGYAVRRLGAGFDPVRHQLLALMREPSEADVHDLQLQGFRFVGFDLIEEKTAISALNNCGGFDGAFDGAELNPSGLISSHDRAYALRSALAALFPSEPHAQCAVWGVWAT